jgi:hypothetical protein
MSGEKLCFVQFIHPGGEHGPDAPGMKRWNVGLHRRKFLRSTGVALDSSRQKQRDELIFWGEWEPESRVDEVASPVAEGPRFVQRPFYSDPPSEGWRQNTDPFVFGDQFHYTGCLQHTRHGPTQLRFLGRGSVILFGSCIGRSKFVLDTLFVVDRWVHHTEADHQHALEGQISDVYRAVTIDSWYSGPGCDSNSYRLYFGATPEQPVGEMFSFFPASTSERHPNGFPRPEIRLDLITPNLTQGKRLNPQTSLSDVRRLWSAVAKQVEASGLLLGVHADLPSAQRF